CRYRFVSSSLLTRAGHNRRLHSFPTRRSSDLAAMKLGSSIAWVLAAGCTALAVQPARAQSWEPTGMPIGFNGPTVLYADTVHDRSEEHTSELQSRENLVCRLLLEKKKKNNKRP